MRYLVFLVLCTLPSFLYGGEIADSIGAYLPDEAGTCGTTEVLGEEYRDKNQFGVCIPITALMDEKKRNKITLAIIELKDPSQIDAVLERQREREKPTEGYEVQVDSFNDDIFKLVDGSILEKTESGYVGYLGYHEEAILYKLGEQWKLCVDSSSFKVDLLKYKAHHYSKNTISGKTVDDIESMEVCD